MSPLKDTRIQLSGAVRESVVALLNRHVTDLTDLFIQTKLAHWNVRGPHFLAYHQMFDELAGHLDGWIDAIAERAATLGGYAGVPVQEVASSTSLPAWPMEVRSGRGVVEALTERWAGAANGVREAIAATAVPDPDTSDLFTEVSRQLDKDLWFLESHLAE